MAFIRKDEGKTSTLSCDGKTVEEIFVSAAHGLFDVVASGSKIRGDQRQEIVVQADGNTALFAAWIAELLSRITDLGMLYSDFEVFSIQKAGSKQYVLTGALYGEPQDNERHTIVPVHPFDPKSAVCKESTSGMSCSFILTRS